MFVSDQVILKGTRETLERLKTCANDARALSLINTLEIALGELDARATGRAASLHASCVTARQLIETGTALSLRIGKDRYSGASREVASNSIKDIVAGYIDLKRPLTKCVLALSEAIATGTGDAKWRSDVRHFFREVAQHDAERAAQDAIPPSQRSGVDLPLLNVDGLSKYLATHPGTEGLRGPFQLHGAKQISGGFSRQTVRLDVCDADGNRVPLIIRKQVRGGFLDGACNWLAEEKPFIDLCYRDGLPVPRLLWHEYDASILGGEFFVTEFMPGQIVGSSYQMAEGLGDEFIRGFARLLARLHTLDWSMVSPTLRALSRIPTDVDTTAAVAARAMVDQFELYWRSAELDPLPSLELILDWLKRNVPTTDRRSVLCHGDLGFHNMLIKEGQICALLDWETSRLADPARDLSYVYTLVTHYVEWDRFMAWYREAGGPEVDRESLAYYSVFAAFAHVIVCEVAMGNTLPKSPHPDLGYLQLGLPIRAYFFNEVMRDCTPIWAEQ